MASLEVASFSSSSSSSSDSSDSDFRSQLRNRDGTKKRHGMQGKHVRGNGFTHRLERKLCVWLNRQYGCRIDPDDRRTFVDTLADGVVLCKLVRDLSGNTRIKFTASGAAPGAGDSGARGSPHRRTAVSGGVYAMNENIQTFSRECRSRGIDSVVTLSPSDLRGEGNPGKVMACLMNLYRKSADWPGRIKVLIACGCACQAGRQALRCPSATRDSCGAIQ